MMQKFTDRFLSLLQKLANWKVILLLAGLYVLFSIFILPIMQKPTGVVLPMLDTRFWYTPSQAEEVITQYSPEARQATILSHLTLDLLYPLLYASLLSTLLVAVFRTATPAQQRQVPLLPWRAAVADVLENVGLVFMFSLFPERFDLLGWITTIFTALKWLQLAFSLLALLVGLLLRLLKRSPERV